MSNPTAVISTPISICSGNSAIVNFTGTPNAIVTYTINSGSNLTQLLDSSGLGTLTIPNVTFVQQIDLINVSVGSSFVCTQNLSQSVTISIIPNPTVTIAATTAICSGSSASITFTGTPNAIATYSINSGASQQQILDSVGLATQIIPNVTSALQIALSNITIGVSPSCSQNLTQVINVNVITTPTAVISALTPVCSGSSSTINFSGTPNATITYTVDSGPNQIQNLDNIGQASVTISNITNTVNIALVSASLGGVGTCFQGLSQSIAINVLPLPIASIAAPLSVCIGSSTTVNFSGTPNALVTYTIDGGPNQSQTLDSSGQAALVFSNVMSNKTIQLLSVTSGSSPVCLRNLSQSIVIIVNPTPTAGIAVNPSTICSNQNASLTFTGSPNATVFYTTNGVNEQSTILDSSGNSIIALSNLSATTSYQITRALFAISGCNQSLSGVANIIVNQIPTASFSGDLVYCSGETTSIDLQSNIVGTTFSWTATQDQVSGASSGSGNQISQTLETTASMSGTVQYVVTPEFNGCQGNQLPINIVVHETPTIELQDGAICLPNSGGTSSTPFILDTMLNALQHSFQWFYEGSPIVGATGSIYPATQVGQYAVQATNILTGCTSSISTVNVSEKAKGEYLTIQQSDAFSLNQTIVVNVVGGSGPFYISWMTIYFNLQIFFTIYRKVNTK